MARTAVSELQEQIDEVRREAFAAGYAAAMKVVRELASHPAPAVAMAAPRRLGRGGSTRKSAAAEPTRRGPARASRGAANRPRPAGAGRGSNAQIIEEILEAASPRALRQAEIRKALQGKGREVAFTSIRHALSQLEARSTAEQVGNSKTWRYRGAS